MAYGRRCWVGHTSAQGTATDDLRVLELDVFAAGRSAPGFIACPIVLVIPTGVLPGRGLSGKLAGDEGPTPINDATYERGVRSYLQVSLRVNP